MITNERIREIARCHWKRDQWNIEYFDSIAFARAIAKEQTEIDAEVFEAMQNQWISTVAASAAIRNQKVEG